MLRWGILGTSFISEVMAAAIARDRVAGEPVARVQAVAGRTPATLAAFGQQVGARRVSLDYDEVIGDPEVDVVYIALPNHLHHEYVVRAAQAGKHILCEKSLSVDLERTDVALDAVRRAGVFFMEGLMYLTHPLTHALVRELRSGVLGRLRMIDASYSAAISQVVNPAGRGAVYNLGTYPASLMRVALQAAGLSTDLAELRAIGLVAGPEGNVVETSASLRFDSGVIGRLHCAETYGAEVAGFSVTGERGRLRLGSNPWLPGAVGNRLEVEVYGQPARTVEVPAEDDAYLYQVRHVRDCLSAGRLEAIWPAPGLNESRELMELLTRWEADAKTHSAAS